MAADGLRETSEVRSFMSAATNVNPRDPAGTIRAITASAIGAVAQVRNDNPDMLESVMQVRLRVIKAPTRGGASTQSTQSTVPWSPRQVTDCAFSPGWCHRFVMPWLRLKGCAKFKSEQLNIFLPSGHAINGWVYCMQHAHVLYGSAGDQ